MSKLYKKFDEAIHMLLAPSSTIAMLVCLYQSGAGDRGIYDKNESYIYSDIPKSTTIANLTDLLHR